MDAIKIMDESINRLTPIINNWNTVEKFFNENKRIQQYWKSAKDEFDENQSTAIRMTDTIERLLDEIDKLKR